MELKTARDVRVAIAGMGLRVSDIAALAGISQPYLSQVLYGKRNYHRLLRNRIEQAVREAAKQVPDDAERPGGLVRLPVLASRPTPRIRRL